MTTNVYISLADDKEVFFRSSGNYINYKLYDPEDGSIYNHELALTPQEALNIAIKLAEAAIPLLAKDDLVEFKKIRGKL